MPHYQQVGTIPHKRHTQFRKPDGDLIFGTVVFNGRIFQRFYRCYITCIRLHRSFIPMRRIDISPKAIGRKKLQHRCLEGFNDSTGGRLPG